MILAGVTQTANVTSAGSVRDANFPYNRELIINQASVFLSGKLAPHVGCFCQITYDGASARTTADNIEVRVADEFKGEHVNLLYGLSLNNTPTMSDVFNTTPVWGWPYTGSSVSVGPNAGPIISEGLAQQVGGLTAYALVNRTLYLEAGAYKTADGALSWMKAGVPTEDLQALDGAAPYYRAYLQHEWGKGRQSIEVGAFGLRADKFPDYAVQHGPTDRYDDSGFDAQYQYITDKHRFSFMHTTIHEKQTLDGTFAAGGSSNLHNTVDTTNTKVSYYYNKWYGVSAGYQTTSGSSDALLYDTGDAVDGSINASPKSEAFIGELNWLISPTNAQHHRRARLVLQYTAYSKFNGASSNYDGFGRNASDNNTLFLAAWLMY
jgi:hypothetical protein